MKTVKVERMEALHVLKVHQIDADVLGGRITCNYGRTQTLSTWAYIIERKGVRTEKTRVKLGPENLVKVTFDGKVEFDWRKRIPESWKSVEIMMSRGIRL